MTEGSVIPTIFEMPAPIVITPCKQMPRFIVNKPFQKKEYVTDVFQESSSEDEPMISEEP